MVTRIFYKKENAKGFRVSNVVYNSKGIGYYAMVNKSTGEWKICNAKRRNVIKKGFNTNFNSQRRKVRDELIKLDVKFNKMRREQDIYKQMGKKINQLSLKRYDVKK